jgi:hypothetical protein
VNPNAITDPQARQANIAAIEQNRARIANYGRNAKLYQAHSVIIERAPPSIADAHRTLGLPIEEIAALLDAADISVADRTALLAPLR